MPVTPSHPAVVAVATAAGLVTTATVAGAGLHVMVPTGVVRGLAALGVALVRRRSATRPAG